MSCSGSESICKQHRGTQEHKAVTEWHVERKGRPLVASRPAHPARPPHGSVGQAGTVWWGRVSPAADLHHISTSCRAVSVLLALVPHPSKPLWCCLSCLSSLEVVFTHFYGAAFPLESLSYRQPVSTILPLSAVLPFSTLPGLSHSAAPAACQGLAAGLCQAGMRGARQLTPGRGGLAAGAVGWHAPGLPGVKKILFKCNQGSGYSKSSRCHCFLPVQNKKVDFKQL